MASKIHLKRNRIWYALLAFHVIACLIAFNKAWTRPDNFTYANTGDSMKNYFIMDSYLNHDSPKGALHYAHMNYPFGDYVYFTDNTPIFGWFVKLFSKYLFDITPYWLYLFHLLVPLNILATACLTWRIANRFLNTTLMRVLATVAIPWTNVQVTRIETTSNLSYSFIIIGTLYLLMRIYDYRHHVKKLWKYWTFAFLLAALSFYIHGYYIALVSVVIFMFHLFWFLVDKHTSRRVQIIGALVPLLALAVDFVVVWLTDDMKHERATHSAGYDWIEWKTQLLGLITPYWWDRIRFFFEGNRWINYESHNYLGAFALYGSLLLLLWLWYKRQSRDFISKHLLRSHGGPLMMLMFASAFFSLILSYGNITVWSDDGIKFHNVWSPFYWLSDYVPMVSQFRALGRFGWVLFFPVFFIVARLWERALHRWPNYLLLKAFASLTIWVLLVDTYDMVKFLNNRVQKPNPLSKSVIDNVPIGMLDAKQYQAILPLPVYATGPDVEGLVIDPPDNWATFTMQLSKKTDLPLMTLKLNRTPVYQARALMNTVVNYKMDNDIAQYLNNKPVLVATYKPIVDNPNSYVPTQSNPARHALANGENFAQRLNLPLVFENDSLAYYRWDWQTTLPTR